VFATALKPLGCDYVSASSGGALPSQVISVAASYQVFLAERIRQRAEIPTVAAGIINQPAQAEGILRAGSADLIALGRGITYNPRWAWHAAAELGEENVYFPPQYARSHPSMRLGDFYKVYNDP
jgi:2,4-dienoyl-CoA reductase-like NADH-dependent reductase (Old Yellow Enzyme family)